MRHDTIKVGIKTNGAPLIEPRKDGILLRNMLIGDGFHWEKTIEALLPGELEPFVSCGETPEADRHVTLINTLPVETYLECVVGSEMNPEAPIEFLKAHAVISRSWVLGKILGAHIYPEEGRERSHQHLIGWEDNCAHRGFHVCSDDHCQRYQGLQPISSAALNAIYETAGEILCSSDGNIVDARFSKCCGGKTEIFSTCWQNVDVECIESFDDPWCDLSDMEAKQKIELLSTVLKDYDLKTEGYGYRWHAKVSKVRIRENLKRLFNREIGVIQTVEALHRGASGRIDRLRLQGSDGTLEIGKELWIRRLLSDSHLYSSAFDIEDKGDDILLAGRGWGHGVGLCQIGAANMALHGHTYREILSFYYPASIITLQKYMNAALNRPNDTALSN